MSFLTGLLAPLAGNVVLGWLGRRVLEVGGWLGAILPLFMTMPPEHRDVIIAILTGQGGQLSLAAAFGFVVYIASQVMSLRSTVKEHTVIRGKKYPVLTEAEARAATGWHGDIEDRTHR